jgi:hypothetical protein
MLCTALWFCPYRSSRLSGALPDSLMLLSFRLSAFTRAGARYPESVEREVSVRFCERSGLDVWWPRPWPLTCVGAGRVEYSFIFFV